MALSLKNKLILRGKEWPMERGSDLVYRDHFYKLRDCDYYVYRDHLYEFWPLNVYIISQNDAFFLYINLLTLHGR